MAYYPKMTLAIENNNQLFKPLFIFKSRYGRHREQKIFLV